MVTKELTAQVGTCIPCHPCPHSPSQHEHLQESTGRDVVDELYEGQWL